MWCWRTFRLFIILESFKSRKKLVDKLVEKCRENIDGNELIYNGALNGYENSCNSCTI